MENDWKKRLGTVYSTNPEYRYEMDGETEEETLPAHEQDLRVRPEKKGRKGKTVTLVTGFRGKLSDLEDLARTLKSRCGTGGSVKDGEVIIQGDFTEKIISILRENNFKAKRSGG